MQMSQSLPKEGDPPQHKAETFYISDLAKEFEVTARTLRYYEEKGLLTPRRDRGGERVYGRSDRNRIATILTAKKMGFTIREVRAILADPKAHLGITLDASVIEAQIAILERQLQEINEALDELRSMLRSTLAKGSNG